jgi:soluble lytic murein transglycosylase-like protein
MTVLGYPCVKISLHKLPKPSKILAILTILAATFSILSPAGARPFAHGAAKARSYGHSVHYGYRHAARVHYAFRRRRVTPYTRFASLRGSSQLVDMVAESAQRHGVPVGLAQAIIKIESGYNCRAHSRNGAIGIGQILPATARAEGVSGNLYECSIGLEASMRYLSHALSIYGGACEAASAYNQGLAARPRCTGYGRRAMWLSRLGT